MTAAKTPADLHQHLAKAYNERDVERLLALFEPNATLVPQPGQFARGSDEIRGALTGFIQIGGVMEVKTVDIVTAGDHALTRTAWSIVNGNQTTVQANGLEILRKGSDGAWRFLVDHPFGASAQA
jgi:uncharacterized protein (TIGR02246 family)